VFISRVIPTAMFTVVNEMAVAQLWRTLTFLNGTLLGRVTPRHYHTISPRHLSRLLICARCRGSLRGVFHLPDALRARTWSKG
jgi:hypothetical protein